MQPGESSRSKKNSYRFSLGSSTSTREIFLSSNFDSGNIELVKQLSETHYRLAAVPDFDSQSHNKKTWFYFKARAPRYVKLKLVIENVEILSAGYHLPTAKPVYRIGDEGSWQRLADCYLSVSQLVTQYRDDMEIQIDYTFTSEESVYFALSVPFSYLECHDYLLDLQQRVRPDVYFCKEVLTYSANQLIVNLLTITHNHQMNEFAPGTSNIFEDKVHQNLFPDGNRPIKINKPVVLILCRVHPGEASASHTLIGMLNFLCLSGDPRAYLLRRLFLFMVVPIVNPDGVYEGNYRMDSFATNLNRIYDKPCPEQQPSIFAIVKLVEYLNAEQRLAFVFDLHGHTSAKGSFIYGNAFDNIVSQVESQAFAKVLQMNNRHFQYDACNFSEKHMKVKDKYEPLTKEGCARVVLGRASGIIHCFTIESGLHTVEEERLNELVAPNNPSFEIPNQQSLPTQRVAHADKYLDMNYELGESILISILDIVEKNPYSRIPNSQYASLEALRRNLANEIFQEEERFKMLDLKAYQKTKNIIKLIQEAFTDKIQRKWQLCFDDLMGISWPEGFQGFKSLRREKLSIPRRLPQNTFKKQANMMTEGNAQTTITDDSATQNSITQPNNKRNLVKSLSPMHRQSTRNLVPQDTRISKLTLKLEHRGLDVVKKTQQHISTRKLLRDFRNETYKKEAMAMTDGCASMKTEPSIASQQTKDKVNAIAAISEESDQLFSAENKDRLQVKLQNRNRNIGNAITSIKSRVKTQLANPTASSTPDQGAIINPLSGKSNSRPGLREVSISPDFAGLFLQKQTTLDATLVDGRLRKVRESKREIINIKLSEIRKKSQKGGLLKLPEIKRLKYELYNCSRLQEDRLSLYADAVASTALQIETIKAPASIKEQLKGCRQ